MAACPSGYAEYNESNSTSDQVVEAARRHGSNALNCIANWCEPAFTEDGDRVLDAWSRYPNEHAYVCIPQPQPSYSSWGGSPSAGQTLLGGLVGLFAWGLANSTSGQSSSGSGYSGSVPDTTAAEQGRREQEFIQLQRQEQQMRQYHPPQP